MLHSIVAAFAQPSSQCQDTILPGALNSQHSILAMLQFIEFMYLPVLITSCDVYNLKRYFSEKHSQTLTYP